MKDEIVKILEKYEFDPESGWDSQDRHIDDSDFDKIADDIIKLIMKNILKDTSKDLDFRKQMIDMFMKGSIAYEIKDDKVRYVDPLDPDVVEAMIKRDLENK